jgi:predicted DNA-binding WGR domain protein
MRTFTFTDGKSNKFWSIERKGKSVTVTFGKVGTRGQSQTRDFPDEAATQKEVGKLIAEKLKKGYEETTPAPAEPAAAAPAPAAGAPGARTFVLADNRSNPVKFWSIELKGKSFALHSGKVGSEGKTQTKRFADEPTARTAHDQLVAEKVAQKYREVVLEELADPACERVFVRFGYMEPVQPSPPDRFWNIAQDGATLVCTWGDVPTNATDSAEVETSNFADEAEARRERDRRIARKVTEASSTRPSCRRSGNPPRSPSPATCAAAWSRKATRPGISTPKAVSFSSAQMRAARRPAGWGTGPATGWKGWSSRGRPKATARRSWPRPSPARCSRRWRRRWRRPPTSWRRAWPAPTG